MTQISIDCPSAHRRHAAGIARALVFVLRLQFFKLAFAD
jgi:hypothetical protein